MHVSKWGNSLAVRLPKALIERLGLKAGDEIEIVAADRRRLSLGKDDRRERALARMAARQWALPADYRFSREEANER
jgi:antitoxin MazE